MKCLSTIVAVVLPILPFIPGASAQMATPLTYAQPLSPAGISAVQQRLKQAGAYAGSTDGVWGRDSAAADTLSKLRADFPTSDSAVYSYIVEADRYAQQDKVIDAERLLTKLADDFPASPYAPYALYQAALQALG